MRTALALLAVSLGTTVWAQQHPVALEKNFNPDQCKTCHEDKTKGKAVHSAIAMGCTTCHEVKTENDVTNINLTAPKEQLCFTCHDKSKEEVRHGPYDKGQCTTCHDPHASDFPKQTRAAGNQLCLECHADRKDVGDKVELFKSVSMPAPEFQQIPKIFPNAEVKAGHPWAGHPVSGVPDPRHQGAMMSCLSCHDQHASSQAELIQVQKQSMDFCDACHAVMEQAKREKMEKEFGQPPPAPPSKGSKPDKPGKK